MSSLPILPAAINRPKDGTHPGSANKTKTLTMDTNVQPGTSGIEHPDLWQQTDEYYTRYPNRWSTIREVVREPAAEALGTMFIVLFGCGVNCQAGLSSHPAVAASPQGDPASVALVWGASVALGVWVAGGISGGHINPAVTLVMAAFRGFPWKKVPGYIFGQLIGALVGALVVYGNYARAIDLVEGGTGVRSVPGTASLFAAYSLDYVSPANCFFDEFIGTFALVFVIFAVTDKYNGSPPPGLVPLAIFVVVLGIAAAFGMQTSFAINPARDLGPRIMTAMVGYGREVFNYRSQFWLWCQVLGPVSGALVAAFIYDALIYTGPESIFNRPNHAARAHQAEARVGAAV
ncbi:aquaporin [Vararia minispora EC-137]|uniref:Aquaporin n=1 Tax=Vararia minispora EC-137 TaxID=1314806 RepID=A0ACB8QH17_9AGAM|nr:aquaporin [Vararia minispora EC-137]